jgi:hypothetical protein
MPPLIPRRRSRRRSVSGRVVLILCGLVVTALLVGGLTQVSRQSGSFDASQNRSFVALASVVARESNSTAAQTRRLLTSMAGQRRPALQANLDDLVQQVEGEATGATAIAVPQPPTGVQAQFADVLALRSTAVRTLRASLDGLLGMHPLPVTGATGSAHTAAASPTLLSSTTATDRIAAAGAMLVRSDRSYRSLRKDLERAVGHARLPASTWVTNAQVWQVGSVAAEVDLLSASPTLAATHRLVLRTVRLSPPTLPTTGTASSPGVSVLSPTSTVTVSVVLSDLGSVDEPDATVQFTMTSEQSGVAVVRSRTSSVASGLSVTLDPVVFAVKPGHTYQLRVAVVLPPAQTDDTGTSQTDDLQIAPGT